MVKVQKIEDSDHFLFSGGYQADIFIDDRVDGFGLTKLLFQWRKTQWC